MPFWTDHVGKDPKRNYRFLVNLGNLPNGASWYAKKMSKPSFKVTESKHSYLNHNFYYPGRVEWDTVTVTLVDPVDPDAVKATMQLIQASGYKPPGTFADTTTIAKSTALTSLGRVECTVIDSQGNDLENWVLEGAFITDVKFSELSYEDDNLQEITLTFRYDWAVLNDRTFKKGPNIDAQVVAVDAGI